METADQTDFSALVRTIPDGLDPTWTFEPPESVRNTEKNSILEDLLSDEKWDEFLDHLISDVENLNDSIQTQSFIRDRRYRDICELVAKGDYKFSVPTRIEIPKPGKKETRKIYTFKKGRDIAEHTVVRMISWLMNRYNYFFSPNLFSVSDNDGVRGAVNHLMELLGDGKKHCYKADLSNFFNSIDINLLIGDLYDQFDERDHNLVKLMEDILRNPTVRAVRQGHVGAETIEDNEKGVMAGMPFQSFLSNFFLKDLDWLLYLNHIFYYRYADDMMVVSESSEELDRVKDFVVEYIHHKRLILNPKKVERYYPGEDFIFLGICFANGTTSISDSTVQKQKARIREAQRKYRRRYERGLVTRDTAVAMMVRWLSGYHYGSDVMPYSFSKMYFPLISSSQRLNKIDRYAQECIRYVYSGKMRLGTTKEASYPALKMLGYLPLVSGFRIYKERQYHPHNGRRRKGRR